MLSLEPRRKLDLKFDTREAKTHKIVPDPPGCIFPQPLFAQVSTIVSAYIARINNTNTEQHSNTSDTPFDMFPPTSCVHRQQVNGNVIAPITCTLCQNASYV